MPQSVKAALAKSTAGRDLLGAYPRSTSQFTVLLGRGPRSFIAAD